MCNHIDAFQYRCNHIDAFRYMCNHNDTLQYVCVMTEIDDEFVIQIAIANSNTRYIPVSVHIRLDF